MRARDVRLTLVFAPSIWYICSTFFPTHTFPLLLTIILDSVPHLSTLRHYHFPKGRSPCPFTCMYSANVFGRCDPVSSNRPPTSNCPGAAAAGWRHSQKRVEPWNGSASTRFWRVCASWKSEGVEGKTAERRRAQYPAISIRLPTSPKPPRQRKMLPTTSETAMTSVRLWSSSHRAAASNQVEDESNIGVTMSRLAPTT
jgi:hypothetical protein